MVEPEAIRAQAIEASRGKIKSFHQNPNLEIGPLLDEYHAWGQLGVIDDPEISQFIAVDSQNPRITEMVLKGFDHVQKAGNQQGIEHVSTIAQVLGINLPGSLVEQPASAPTAPLSPAPRALPISAAPAQAPQRGSEVSPAAPQRAPEVQAAPRVAWLQYLPGLYSEVTEDMINKLLRTTDADVARLSLGLQTTAEFISKNMDLPRGASFRETPQVEIVKEGNSKTLVVSGSIVAKVGLGRLAHEVGRANFTMKLANNPDGSLRVRDHELELSGQAEGRREGIERQIQNINQALLDKVNGRIHKDWRATGFEIVDGGVNIVYQRKSFTHTIPAISAEEAARMLGTTAQEVGEMAAQPEE